MKMEIEDPQQIIKILQSYISKKNLEGYYPLAKNEFRVSSVSKCPRQLWLEKILGQPANIKSLEGLGRVTTGRLIHEFLESALENESFLVASEKKVEYQYNFPLDVEMEEAGADPFIRIIGHFDLLIHAGGDLCVVDIKSTGQYAWKYVQNGMKQHHAIQANTYAAILGVPAYAILYVNKDTLEMKMFIHETNRSQFFATVDRLTLVYHHVMLRKPLDERGADWECKYCPFQEECAVADDIDRLLPPGVEMPDREFEFDD